MGGPTADFRQPSCQKQLTKGRLPEPAVPFSKPCNNLTVDHTDYVSLLRKLRKLSGVKKYSSVPAFVLIMWWQTRKTCFLQELVSIMSADSFVLHRNMFPIRYFNIWENRPMKSTNSFWIQYEKANAATGRAVCGSVFYVLASGMYDKGGGKACRICA